MTFLLNTSLLNTCQTDTTHVYVSYNRCPMYNTDMVVAAGCRMSKPAGETCCESPECPANVYNIPQPLPEVQTTYDPNGKLVFMYT